MFVWLVAYIAKNTGWQEGTIISMSFAKLLNLTHALLISEGIRTKYKNTESKKIISKDSFDALFQ